MAYGGLRIDERYSRAGAEDTVASFVRRNGCHRDVLAVFCLESFCFAPFCLAPFWLASIEDQLVVDFIGEDD